jgi:polyribonucleotide nucleotidyltransferase
VVAGTRDAVLMVESEAKELPEDIMLGAVLFAHQEMQKVIQVIDELVAEAGKPRWEWQAAEVDADLQQAVSDACREQLTEAYQITEKQARQTRISELRAQLVDKLASDEKGITADTVSGLFGKLEKSIVRGRVIAGEPRIDGRDNKTVRGISVEVGVLPKAHGSALFTRGETQALVAATLGSQRDSMIIDALEGEYKDPFMLHYNFPPYSVGEAGRMVGPGRREIGHGRLARRGISAVLPTFEEFPYALRVVSEITESNGSSSMASVCGSSLALMDAGVPLKAPVAGIAMGLIKEADDFAVLTDILGDEDHLGDMDFKVAGTANGITALQMDIKIEGINEEIMSLALEQALSARLHILGEMNRIIDHSRSEVSQNAPRLYTLRIDQDKIRDVIGKGGATIRSITEESGATVDIEDDGTIKVYAKDDDALQIALRRIEEVTAEAEVGVIYDGKVIRIVDFGAFVEIIPGTEGLLHISQVAEERVEKVTDYIAEGDMIRVKVIDMDQRGRIKLSLKEAKRDEGGATEAAPVVEQSAEVEAPEAVEAEVVATESVEEVQIPEVVAEAPEVVEVAAEAEDADVTEEDDRGNV